MRLRPLEVGEIIDASIKVYRARFTTLLKVVAVLVAPVQVLNALVQMSLPSSDELAPVNEFGEPTFNGSAFLGMFAAIVAVSALAWLATQLATGASMKVISDAYLGQETDWRESLRFTRGKFGSIVWVTGLVSFLSGLGLIACIVPGVYFFVGWSVAVPALVLEDVRGFKAMGRSRQLVEGFWWRAFACVAIAYAMQVGASMVLSMVVMPLALLVDNVVVNAIAQSVGGLVSAVLVTPFIAAIGAVLYFDLRVRKEGFDLELLAHSVGVDPATLPPLPPPTPGWGGGSGYPGYPPPQQPPGWGGYPGYPTPQPQPQPPPPPPPGWGYPPPPQQPPPPPQGWPPPSG